ncbi:thioesterase superfamily protein [Paenibacillus curdlanolyticus YK9]|uniref:Thioesterase superfamily protein n=1 Tax=Paenibacillus curdlanolyticus YK9 TaxID=717606 RepID=E0IAN2_9BACL|nr:thioesterase superfamily protein [Paenibacillus curdlanolyticus YK9]
MNAIKQVRNEQQSRSTMEAKPASASRTVKCSLVLPPDTNHHGTIFGGKLMAYIDDVATIAATRHARRPVVTASTDSVDFLNPVRKGDSVCLTAFVTWANRTSMEIFVRVVTEDLLSGERTVCATSFLTFVALGEDGKPTEVPPVLPQSNEEIQLYDTAPLRKEARKVRRQESKHFADIFGESYQWNVEPASEQTQSAAAAPSPRETDAAPADKDRKRPAGRQASTSHAHARKPHLSIADSSKGGINPALSQFTSVPRLFGIASVPQLEQASAEDEAAPANAFARCWDSDWD